MSRSGKRQANSLLKWNRAAVLEGPVSLRGRNCLPVAIGAWVFLTALFADRTGFVGVVVAAGAAMVGSLAAFLAGWAWVAVAMAVALVGVLRLRRQPVAQLLERVFHSFELRQQIFVREV
jgi:hypothetical protein